MRVNHQAPGLRPAARLRVAVAGTAIAAGVALAGCSSGTTPASPAGSAATSGTSAQQQTRAILAQFARCVRAHGYPNFPDPQVGADGSVNIEGGTQAKQAADVTQAACGPILSRLPASATRHPVTPAMLQTERQFAACMRQHGLPYWPDPRPDGSFPLSTTPYAHLGKSGPVAAGLQACGHYHLNGIVVS